MRLEESLFAELLFAAYYKKKRMAKWGSKSLYSPKKSKKKYFVTHQQQQQQRTQNTNLDDRGFSPQKLNIFTKQNLYPFTRKIWIPSSEKYLNFVSAEFYKIAEEGKCESTLSKDKCQQIADIHGADSVRERPYTDRPTGCYSMENDKKFYFIKNSNDAKCSEKFKCYCSTATKGKLFILFPLISSAWNITLVFIKKSSKLKMRAQPCSTDNFSIFYFAMWRHIGTSKGKGCPICHLHFFMV